MEPSLHNQPVLTIIGTGKLAHHFIPAFIQANIVLKQVCGRNQSTLQVFAYKYGLDFSIGIKNINKDSDIYLLCISDSAIPGVSQDLQSILPKDKIVVHNSGVVPIDAIAFNNAGIFYPFNTFSSMTSFWDPTTPILVEARTESVADVLISLGQRIGERVEVMSSDRRRWLHLGAVFAHNFANQSIAIGQEVFEQNGIDRSLMVPILREMIRRLESIPASELQSGPAIRNDHLTLTKHMKMLADSPEWRNLYIQMSQLINPAITLEDE
jgi:predicted short-subunit dehydrogenase-like oxidoreductase (DUF2520 family)